MWAMLCQSPIWAAVTWALLEADYSFKMMQSAIIQARMLKFFRGSPFGKLLKRFATEAFPFY
jgi:hypothetical protein